MADSLARHRQSVNPAAWVDKYGDYLYRYALSRLRDAESSEEVVQEAFVAGLQHLDQYSGKGAQRAWLLGILKRKIVDYLRQRSRTTRLDSTDTSDELSEALFDHKGRWKADPRVFGADPSISLEREEFWATFRRCLDSLPSSQANAFVLREMDEKGSQEICKDLEVSPSNLWVLLYRARLALAKCMKARWQTERGRQR